MEWRLVEGAVDETGIKKYGKKHRDEVRICFENLANLVVRLNSGVTLQQALSFGFFGSEGENAYRVGQERKGMRETRLYVYARIEGGDIKVLTVGDKDTQKKDVKWCHEWVRKNRKDNIENES